MKPFRLPWIRKLKARWFLRKRMAACQAWWRYTYGGGGGAPVQQTQLAPDGLEWAEDVSPAQWVGQSLSDFAKVRSLLPEGFSAYARLFHPAYLDHAREQPVRWSTVASWTGRTVHPRMQFERVAALSEDPGTSTRIRRGVLFRSMVRSQKRSAGPW